MKCPRCGEEMKEGYIFIYSTYSAADLWWSTHEYKSFSWSAPKDSADTVTLLQNRFGSKNIQRRAYRCEKCGLITFEEKYTLPSEEKKPE